MNLEQRLQVVDPAGQAWQINKMSDPDTGHLYLSFAAENSLIGMTTQMYVPFSVFIDARQKYFPDNYRFASQEELIDGVLARIVMHNPTSITVREKRIIKDSAKIMLEILQEGNH